MEMIRKQQSQLPSLIPLEEPTVTGKYAMLRESFLREHRHIQYMILLTNGKLNQHLMEIQETATQMLETMMPRLQQEAGVTEELKAQDHLRWAGLMNNLKHSAEETIIRELITS